MELDVLALLSQSAMQATLLNATVRGIALDPAIITPHLQQAVEGLYPELERVVADALDRVPAEDLVETISTYANLAALQALRAAGYIEGGAA